jgi:hypothetical protein
MTEDPRDFIDWDEGRDFPTSPPRFTFNAEPCESCGKPTFRGRVWNAEYGLWIATDCQCNTPEVPTCPELAPLIAQANTVREIVRVCKAHRQSCPLCGLIEIRRPSSKEPAQIRKEAA